MSRYNQFYAFFNMLFALSSTHILLRFLLKLDKKTTLIKTNYTINTNELDKSWTFTWCPTRCRQVATFEPNQPIDQAVLWKAQTTNPLHSHLPFFNSRRCTSRPVPPVSPLEGGRRRGKSRASVPRMH